MTPYPRVNEAAAEFARPTDTAPYAASDAVSNSTSAPVPMVFAALASHPGGKGRVVGVRVWSQHTTDANAYRVHLFTAAPAGINDNAPYTQLFASRATYVGYVEVTVGIEGSGSTGAYGKATADLPFKCGNGSSGLWGLLEVKGALTPVSGQLYRVVVSAEPA